jgi:hypothetical protein
MTSFIWARGCRITKKDADPEAVGAELDRLATEHGGRITPRVVVDAARSVASPMHNVFEWDDVRAAELYREDQARHVLHSIRILKREEGKRDVEILHAFVNLTEQVGDDKQRAYVPLARVLSDEDLLNQAVNNALAELRAFEDRYASFDKIARAVRIARESIEHAEQPAA